MVWDKEIADLKVAVTQNEQKFYNMGFIDAENSNGAVMFESQRYGYLSLYKVVLGLLCLNLYKVVVGLFVFFRCTWSSRSLSFLLFFLE